VLTTALMLAGFGGAILLLFLEVGLGEDREHARDEERRRRQADRRDAPRRRRRGRRLPRRGG
jgi:hypothetical protein